MALPSEEEFHAYLDDELPADRRAMVEAYLRDHPEEVQRLQAYWADGKAIARFFARAGEMPARPPPNPSVWHPTGRHATALAALVIGAIAAALIFVWQSRHDHALLARLGADALFAHLALTDGVSQPTITASLHEIADFFSTALKTPVRLRNPSAGQYTLVASKFVAGSRHRAVHLAFETGDGGLVTMYLQPRRGRRDAPFRPVANVWDVTTLAWIDDEVACAVTGSLNPAALRQVANTLYAALFKSSRAGTRDH